MWSHVCMAGVRQCRVGGTRSRKEWQEYGCMSCPAQHLALVALLACRPACPAAVHRLLAPAIRSQVLAAAQGDVAKRLLLLQLQEAVGARHCRDKGEGVAGRAGGQHMGSAVLAS